jgi:hypothetical protein
MRTVSEPTKSSEDKWDFSVEVGDPSASSAHRKIEWKFQPDHDQRSLLPEYVSLTSTLKELTYSMLCEPGRLKRPAGEET